MNDSSVYDFVFRGLLTEEALDLAGRTHPALADYSDIQIASDLGIDSLDDISVQEAKMMAIVYTSIAAWENSVRKLVKKVLSESSDNWWAKLVAKGIQDRANSRREGEEQVKWHAQRGQDLLYYTELGDLENIIKSNENWPLFKPFFNDQEWVASIFNVVERSRNVIMHSGNLARADIQRLGINLRDWITQVGA